MNPLFKPGDIIELKPDSWGEFGVMRLFIVKCHEQRGYATMVLNDASEIFKVGARYYVNLSNQVLYKVIG